jgi:hypothetical protein
LNNDDVAYEPVTVRLPPMVAFPVVDELADVIDISCS